MQWGRGLGMRRPDPSQPPRQTLQGEQHKQPETGARGRPSCSPTGASWEQEGGNRNRASRTSVPFPRPQNIRGSWDAVTVKNRGRVAPMPNVSPRTVIDHSQPHPSRIDSHHGLTHIQTLGALVGVAAQTEACNLLISLLATNWSLSDPLILCYSIFLNPLGFGTVAGTKCVLSGTSQMNRGSQESEN